MIRNIVFDMGNVLLRYDPLLPCLRHAGDPDGATRLREAIFGAPEWPVRMDGGTIAEADFIALVQPRIADERLRALVPAVMADWMLDGLYPIDGMAALTGELHEAGYRLYLLSNMNLRFHEAEYKIPGFPLFSGALISAEEKLLKPDPAIFARLCERYGLCAGECLFVDDVARNVDGARAAGMRGYCFEDGDTARLRAEMDGLPRPQE